MLRATRSYSGNYAGSELYGFLKRPAAIPVSAEEINESIARSRQADDERLDTDVLVRADLFEVLGA